MSEFLIHLRPAPGDKQPPEEIRLRRALKALSRCYGLIVVRIEETNREPAVQAPALATPPSADHETTLPMFDGALPQIEQRTLRSVLDKPNAGGGQDEVGDDSGQ